MKWLIILCSAVLILGCTRGGEAINEGKHGMYWSRHDSSGTGYILYQADTIIQTCYAIYRGGSRGGITEISCSVLANRPEWKPVLSWVAD